MILTEWRINLKKVKKIVFLVCIFTLILAFSGCGKSEKKAKKAETLATNFFEESDKGFVVVYEEEFDKEYYDKDELESMIDAEITEFNNDYAKDKAKGIVKDSFKVSDKTATLKIRFYSWEDYVTYASEYISSNRNARLFIGTYKDAVAAGFNFAGKYVSKDGSTPYDVSTTSEDTMVVFTNEGFVMELSGDVIAYNENVTVKSGKVKTSNRRENYIIFK